MATMCDDHDGVPELVSDSDQEYDKEDEENEWNDDDSEEEMNMLTGNVICLFCPVVESSVDLLLAHCNKQHNFNIIDNCRKWSTDCISYIKMINYIRKMQPSSDDVLRCLSSHKPPWLSDDFMAPTEPTDLMLQMDIEWAISHYTGSQQTLSQGDKSGGAACENQFSDSEAIHALIDRVKKAEEQRDLLRAELDRALEDINKLRISGQNLLTESSDKVNRVPNGISLEEEDGYFASYSHHDIHMTMLKDTVRTESYRDFMFKNPHLFEDKLVLDVGCGTGILSMFAVKAGAKHVVAVDQSNIIYQAMDIARENNVHESITFVKGKLEDVDLPIKKFDVIISEWMGYFLLFEAMFDSVLWARDRYLKVDGCVYPDVFSMLIVGVSDKDLYNSKIAFWDDVYGFKMSCMKSSVTDEVHVRLVKEETMITEPAVIKKIDVMKCSVSDLNFSSEFNLHVNSDSELTALVGYFDTQFDAGCHNKISFSTGPQATPTHWEQAVMLLPTPIAVKKGSSLEGKIVYRKHPNDDRGIVINLSIGKLKLKYTLS
ncbi:protein arginine N-methyltransferase 3-like [Physella acuta]|uniref:protein arginine N-methyltransferase 3-like n=1 Tax=Physella acuta TaxID=109671 RepID=UPI0027DCBE82|nr:protein arginine N-methyltransferase 3-like [Physella acuta]